MARKRQRLVAWLVIVTQLPPSKLEIVTPLPPFSNLQAVEIDTLPSQASNLRGLLSKATQYKCRQVMYLQPPPTGVKPNFDDWH